MPRRSDARRVVLQMLYLIDQNPDADVRRIQDEITEQLKKDELVEFAWDLFRGVREVRDQLDEMIVSVAQNWRLDRMAPTDRNVLRLAIYEMHHMNTPAPVALDEAIELAREFGGENSPGFVNGILDKLIPDEKRAAAEGGDSV